MVEIRDVKKTIVYAFFSSSCLLFLILFRRRVRKCCLNWNRMNTRVKQIKVSSDGEKKNKAESDIICSGKEQM